MRYLGFEKKDVDWENVQAWYEFEWNDVVEELEERMLYLLNYNNCH